VLPHHTAFGEKRMIHDLSCNRDYTCLEGDCPSFVTLTPRPRGRRRAAGADRRSGRAALPSGALPAPRLPAIDGAYGIYFTGIGGTGVVTANRILAAAAEGAGLLVEGLDQTGLSQKAGAVTSHLHLATDRDALGSAAVGRRGADLYLSGDILQAANPVHLAKIEPGSTVAVVDRDVTPTTAMLQSDLAAPDLDSLEAVIRARVGDGTVAFVDSTRIAEDLLGNHLLANVVVLGAAYQLGGLPVSAGDVAAAMARQGASARANRDAFEWGRWAIHDPDVVAARLEAAAPEVAPSTGAFDPSARASEQAAQLVGARELPADLFQLLVRRAAQLIDYQSASRAERFLGLVERAAAHDGATHGWELTRAVAASWFKLLTYKDEYEVARLHLNVDYDRVAADLGIEGPYSVRYHLHPPILRRMGRKKKLPLGRPYEAAFHALRAMRHVRGTPFDVFGWDRDRRLERALIREYEQLVIDSLVRAPALPYDALVAIAESPMAIRGYAGIKERAVEQWRAEVERLQLSRDAAPA
jgi:indolepyruvate ferredoxin oxidoreductase